ncbi:hypothetical protein PG994_014544 [Apiospora phragmitis]|uniref:Reticulon-like protein n=1 Tax=Apiospora phragmitis TaxID=2905665 RepID=A0ABR1T4L9_9PEZI
MDQSEDQRDALRKHIVVLIWSATAIGHFAEDDVAFYRCLATGFIAIGVDVIVFVSLQVHYQTTITFVLFVSFWLGYKVYDPFFSKPLFGD